MDSKPSDNEVQVINSLIAQLGSLEEEARARVVRYLVDRFAPSESFARALSAESNLGILDSVEAKVQRARARQPMDIASLKEEKAPRSANEMAAIVAYYLADVASESERKGTINQDDVEKYFKQAKYPLPKALGQTLLNAKQAGYLDSTGAPGEYKLNPVGYNLVVHALPRSSQTSHSRRRASRTAKRTRRGRARQLT